MHNLKPTKKWLSIEPSKNLREPSVDVVFPLNDEVKKVIAKMIAYIDVCYGEDYKKYNLKRGIAIAAPQLGFNQNIIYIHFDEEINNKEVEHKYLLINPKIISESLTLSYLLTGEGCLSVEDFHEGYVYRKKKIIVKAYDYFLKQEGEIVMDNFLSICAQHEIDHLKGVLFYDHINKKDPFEIKPNAILIK